MTSSRSSKIPTLTLVLVLAVTAVAPAVAINVSDQQVPGEAEVGETVEATIELDNLYQDPNFQTWTLVGQTELENVTWTVAFMNPSGDVFAQRQYNGQEFSQNGISADSQEFDDPVTEISVTVRGDVPAVETYTYPEKESFAITSLTQEAGETGSTNEIDTWRVHHYTTGDDTSVGSQQARSAISSAEGAILEAEEAGADVSQANASLETAIEFYRLGQFQQAHESATTAEDNAVEAKEEAEASQKTSQLLLYAVAAVVVLGLLGGGYWYYKQSQDTYDKLG